MEYNKNGRLISSTVHEGLTLLYRIIFDYKNDKVVKETWRYAVTNDIYDIVVLTYNKNGSLVRNGSIIQSYYTVYTYYPNGGLKSWVFYRDGLPLQQGEYTYDDKFKNPFTTITGLDYYFMYYTSGFWIGIGKKWYSSEKISFWDGSAWAIYYDLDPSKTIWDGGAQNYPLQADYTDKATGDHFLNTFTYENCNGKSAKAAVTDQFRAYKSTIFTKRIHQKMYLRNLLY